MATIEQKKKLIKTIKNPIRYFRLNFSRYGGEVAMGTITKDQYDSVSYTHLTLPTKRIV